MTLIQKWSWEKGIILYATHGDAWSHIDSFLTLGYWWRLWIVQELLFAPDIMMQYGDQTIPWGLLQNMLVKFQKSGSLKENWLVGNMLRGPPARLCYQRLDRDDTGPKPQLLLPLVLKYKNSGCQDTRDKTYGLWSMSCPCCQEGVPVDYHLSPAQICKKLISHHFTHHPSELESMTPTALVREIIAILGVEPPLDVLPHDFVSLGRRKIYGDEESIRLSCYVRGPILYTCQPARVGGYLSAPIPPALNVAVRATMLTFAQQDVNASPSYTKPGPSQYLSDRLFNIYDRKFNMILNFVMARRFWEGFLSRITVHKPHNIGTNSHVFFTADGQMGLATEEFQVGDTVYEFDRKKAEAVVIRAVGERFKAVGLSHAVIGTWRPTWQKRMTLSMSADTLINLSHQPVVDYQLY
jgi:hypothetical protein